MEWSRNDEHVHLSEYDFAQCRLAADSLLCWLTAFSWMLSNKTFQLQSTLSGCRLYHYLSEFAFSIPHANRVASTRCTLSSHARIVLENTLQQRVFADMCLWTIEFVNWISAQLLFSLRTNCERDTPGAIVTQIIGVLPTMKASACWVWSRWDFFRRITYSIFSRKLCLELQGRCSLPKKRMF